jgi:aspartyl protease family protein
MVFIGVALLIAVGLAVVISADAGSLVGMTQEQTGQVIPLLIILILVAGGAFGRRIRLAEMATNIILWAGIFSVAILGYAFREEFSSIASRVAGEFSPGVAIVSEDGNSAKFRRALTGSFRLNVKINDAEMPMVFDTGASAVVLTREDARAAGISTDSLRYNVQVQTANGVGRAAATNLERISVGEIERRNIRAFVAEDGALETSLLGMTFLETLSGYVVTPDAVEFRD